MHLGGKKIPRFLKPMGLVRTLLVVNLALSGCTTDAAGLFNQVDRNDICGVEHAELAGSQSFFTRSIVQGAALGALLGTLGGLAVGLGRGEDVGKSAAIGGVAGAAAGAISGYYTARQAQAADQQALASQIWDDLQEEAQQIDRATVTFIKVRDCRFRAAQSIKANFRSGAITRDEAQQRLQDQKMRFEQEVTLANEMGARMAERQQEHRFAADELRQTVAANPPPPSAGAFSSQTPVPSRGRQDKAAKPSSVKPASITELTRDVSVAATETNVQKRNVFEKEVAKSNADKDVIFAMGGTRPTGSS
jgi:hypothetical protein